MSLRLLSVPVFQECGGDSLRWREKNQTCFGVRRISGSRFLGPVCVAAGKAPKKQDDNMWKQALDKMAKRKQKSQKRNQKGKTKTKFSRLKSKMLLVDKEEILQGEEVIQVPLWNTFASNNHGTWRGVGAAFCPENGTLLSIGLDEEEQECEVVTSLRPAPKGKEIHREVLWSFRGAGVKNGDGLDEGDGLEDHDINLDEGENEEDAIHLEDDDSENDDAVEEAIEESAMEAPAVEDKAMKKDVMERVCMRLEPGLVYFEDGSYSHGPSRLMSADRERRIASHNIEHCLVRGGHKRVRIIHSFTMDEVTGTMDLLSLSVFEEEWIEPVNATGIRDSHDTELRWLSSRKRLRREQLTGKWKVFETNASPAAEEQEESETQLVYMCKEFTRQRKLGQPSSASDDDPLIWLPGGLYTYVDLNQRARVIRFGAGWLEQGVNLVMERDYDPDTTCLLEVRSQSEVRFQTEVRS